MKDFCGSVFECDMCGYVVLGAKPDQCPSCEVGALRELAESEREQVSKTAMLIMEWDEDALTRMERIPAGFMRTMTKCRIELWARKQSKERVTMEAVTAKYGNWAEGSDRSGCRLAWSADALSRVERIPGFVRPMVIREIERTAKSSGQTIVNGEMMDRAVGQWKRLGIFHHSPNR